MWALYVLVGLVLGFMLGFSIVVWSQVNMDRKSIEIGIIKLCGRFFTLTEIDV